MSLNQKSAGIRSVFSGSASERLRGEVRDLLFPGWQRSCPDALCRVVRNVHGYKRIAAAALILGTTLMAMLLAASTEARVIISDDQLVEAVRLSDAARATVPTPALVVTAPVPAASSPAATPTVPAAIADADPLASRVSTSSRGGLRPTPDISTPTKFIAAVAGPAQESQRECGVPAPVTIAQAILESEWGRSGLSKKGQNYFGIKATVAPGPAGVINMDTWEVFGGVDTVIKAGFKAYHSLEESVVDHGYFLKNNPRYADAFKVTDPKEFARRIHVAGYATDPSYCTKVASLIDQYHLDQYDLNSSTPN